MPEHPILPCGYNSWENDGDEVNGAGVNEPVWPVLADCFIPLQPLIITDAMLAVFDGCADILIANVDNVAEIPGENPYVLLGDDWPDWVAPAVAATLSFPYDQHRQAISKVSAVITPKPANDTITLRRGVRTQAIGRRR